MSHDMILGKPWLEQVNPKINWHLNLLSFTSARGKEHQWIASTKQREEDSFLSAHQLQRLTKRHDTTAYLCIIKDMKAFHENVEKATRDKPAYLRKLIKEYNDVFQDVDFLPPSRGELDHHIPLVPDVKPTWQPIYGMTEDELKRLKDELDRLLALGHIQPSTSSFGAPLFFVAEKNGKV